MTNIFYSWNTKKTATGFEAVVFKNTSRATANAHGQFCDSEELQRITVTSRAIAKRLAQKWVRYYKASNEVAA